MIAEAFFGTFAFVPVVDGKLIKESPVKQLETGAVNGVSHSCPFRFHHWQSIAFVY
jgi:hypothetical protein